MITQEKIKTFKAYNGDIDAWGHAKRKNSSMTDNDWYLIASLVQDLSIVRQGLTSESYINELEEKLKLNCDNIETIQYLKEHS